MKFTSFSLVFLVIAISCVYYVQADNFGNIVGSLPQFQISQSGFKGSARDEYPTLAATNNALLISSLYGLNNKIDVTVLPNFINSFRNSDGGYGPQPNYPSELESTRNAVLAYSRLGVQVPDGASIINYINSLLDEETSLFANRVGAKSSIKYTALALETLDVLGAESTIAELENPLNDYLNENVVSNENTNLFSFEDSDLTPTAGNYYGILVGTIVDFAFEEPRKWATYLVNLQTRQGGFQDGNGSISFESNLQGVASLHLLKDTANYMSSVQGDILRRFVQNIPFELEAAAQAHEAIARSDKFNENFKVSISYEGVGKSQVSDNAIVQGSKVRPIVGVKAFSGAAHAGLSVGLSLSFEDNSKQDYRLVWNAANNQYEGESFIDFGNKLGGVAFLFSFDNEVAGVGNLNFFSKSEKLIGYAIDIDANAVHQVTGNNVEVGKAVTVGTDFDFGVKLSNTEEDSIESGNFVVKFDVLDSSAVTISSESIDGSENEGPLSFQYTLDDASIPAGDLLFRFQVEENGKVVAVNVLFYRFNIPMIATDIQFNDFDRSEAAVYSIGDSVAITMVPASYLDSRSVKTYATDDESGAPIAANRHFFADAFTPSGDFLFTTAGTPVEESDVESKYLFEFDIDATFDSLGTTVISFRYEGVKGGSGDNRLVLSNYDSFYEELFEDSQALNYTVSSDLHLENVEKQPSDADFFYGNTIEFQFSVIDRNSNQLLQPGTRGNVFMLLNHLDASQSSTFTSTKEPATVVTDDADNQTVFDIAWEINPNAVKGEGFLTLVVEDADSNEISLFEPNASQQAVSYKINIGGDIDVQYNTFSTESMFSRQTAFVLEFTLSCSSTELRNAKLRSSILYNGQEIDSLPVIVSDASYSLSWTTDHPKSPSGKYVVQIFREADFQRQAQQQESIQKQLRAKQRQAEIDGERFDEQAFINSLPLDKLEPLFEATIDHSQISTRSLPIRFEWLITIPLIVTLVYITQHKYKVTTSKRRN